MPVVNSLHEKGVFCIDTLSPSLPVVEENRSSSGNLFCKSFKLFIYLNWDKKCWSLCRMQGKWYSRGRRGGGGVDPGMDWFGPIPPPFWQLNHANSAYFGAISANFPSISTLGPLFLQILHPALILITLRKNINCVWEIIIDLPNV